MKLGYSLQDYTVPCDRCGRQVTLDVNFCRHCHHCVNVARFKNKYKKEPPRHPW